MNRRRKIRLSSAPFEFALAVLFSVGTVIAAIWIPVLISSNSEYAVWVAVGTALLFLFTVWLWVRAFRPPLAVVDEYGLVIDKRRAQPVRIDWRDINSIEVIVRERDLEIFWDSDQRLHDEWGSPNDKGYYSMTIKRPSIGHDLVQALIDFDAPDVRSRLTQF